MDLDIIIFALSGVLLARAAIFKWCYEKHEAICLDYHTSNTAFVTYPLYEYEILEDGEMVTYQNWGICNFSPKKGKKYKVLVYKKNHDKVVAFNEYTFNLSFGTILLLWSLKELLSW